MDTEVKPNSDAASWEFLPEHPLVVVFTYLKPSDRLNAGLTCKAWSECLKHPVLWRRFVCRFTTPGHEKLVSAVVNDGHRIRALVLEVDQQNIGNRTNACRALHSLAENEQRRLTSFTLRFVGENPFLYAGSDFMAELRLLFGCAQDKTEPFSYLTHVDLSRVNVVFESKLIDILSENQPQLEFLNIQNKSLVCKVDPDSIVRLASNCRKLRDLRLINVSVNDEVLSTFAALDEPCLEHLSMAYTRETKFTLEQSSEVWSALVKRLRSFE
ncbi:hypothetical protein BaRGS_00036135 [Batillaria attramentaria]|uniref:F-box domain-containing protein n=1 Tax=Batillaria attramentaria TaxID=370345 RepID=A0ABD0JC82_9CAEN